MDALVLVDQQERTFISCADNGCNLEKMPGAMDGRNGWQERIQRTLCYQHHFIKKTCLQMIIISNLKSYNCMKYLESLLLFNDY